MLQSIKSKKIWLVGGAVLAALALGGSYLAYSLQSYPLSVEEAQTIALESAGLEKTDATFTRTEKELEDGKKTYEIEFYTTDATYEFTIDGTSGSILDRDVDSTLAPTQETKTGATSASTTEPSSSSSTEEKASVASSSSEASTNQAVATNAVAITEEKAKEAALQHAGLKESAVSQLTVQLDMDNGQQVYEVDFNDTATGLDYDYTIDAQTGQVVEHSSESLANSQ